MSGSGTPHSEWLADVLEAAESKEHEPDNPEMLMAVGVIALAGLGYWLLRANVKGGRR